MDGGSTGTFWLSALWKANSGDCAVGNWSSESRLPSVKDIQSRSAHQNE